MDLLDSMRSHRYLCNFETSARATLSDRLDLRSVDVRMAEEMVVAFIDANIVFVLSLLDNEVVVLGTGEG